MDNSSILISVIIVLCIAAGVTAYGLTNDSNTVFNDLAGFTPDASGDTGIGNNSTNGTGTASGGYSSGSSGSSYSSSSSSSGSSGSGGHAISPERAKQLAENAARSDGWTAYCTSATYNSGGYYYCVLRDNAGNTGYALIGSGTGRLLEGAWSKQVTPSPDDVEDDYKENSTSNSTD